MPADYKKRLNRLLEMLRLIQAEPGWNKQKFVEHFKMTERTIFRDLDVLRDSGFPIFYDDQRECYRMQRDYFMPPVQMTLQESLALISLAEQVAGSEQLPLMQDAAAAIEKVRCALPLKLRDQLEEHDGQIKIHLAASMPADGIEDVYDRMRQAIANKRELTCQYESLSGNSEGEVFAFRPYQLFFSQRAWYAVGYHCSREEVRSLKLNRFEQVTPTDKPYAIPDDFSLADHLGLAWRMIRGEDRHEVVLHFNAEFAETISDTHWHQTQEIELQDDGSILFRCTVEGLDEIVWWILSMGPNCRVLEPKALRDKVAELARATAEQYDEAEKSKVG